MLTAAQVAKRLNTSPNTVRDWVAAGRLRSVRLPSGRLRIPLQAVEDIEAGRNTAGAA